MSRAAFPTPYAGTYYPIYNSGVNQYIPPTPDMPFNKVSAIFVAFAHAYPIGGTSAAELLLEEGQPEEPIRLSGLTSVAREVNPGIKILISLGWGKNDWTYISADYTSRANQFPASVVAFIRQYQLDGFDIDDESINGESGSISQPDFDAVIQNLRSALDSASAADGKPYYLTITPAGGSTQVDSVNMGCFDLINVQCYGGSLPNDFTGLGYPLAQIAWGINTEGCTPDYPSNSQYQGLAGIFNWTMSADSACNYKYTQQIASDVGYSAGM
jgi:GH18 family chitinase